MNADIRRGEFNERSYVGTYIICMQFQQIKNSQQPELQTNGTELHFQLGNKKCIQLLEGYYNAIE